MACMVHDSLDMHGCGIAVSFSRLSHYIADIDFHRLTAANGITNALYQKIRYHTGIQTAWPQHNSLRIANGVQGGLHRLGMLWIKLYPMNLFVSLWNLGFTAYHRAILHNGIQTDKFLAGWQNLSLYRQNLGGFLQGCFHISSNLSHGSNKQIAEAMT